MLGVRPKPHRAPRCRRALQVARACRIAFIIVLIPCRASTQSQAPPSRSSLEQQIRAALAQGATSQAQSGLAQLLAQPQLESGVLLRVGIAFAQHSLYSEASQAFARCVRDDPTIFEAHYNLALAQLAQDRPLDAFRTIDQAPHTSPRDSTARLYLRGKIEFELGRNQAAEQDLSAAFDQEPGEENYALDLGLFYLRDHSYPQAERVFTRSSDLSPRSTYLLLGLALAQFLGGRTSQSVESSRRLLALAPDFSIARLLLGFTLYFNGDFDAARQAARDGIALPNPDPYLYYLDAAASLKQHDDARALSDLAAAERGLPSCALCYVASGKAREHQDDLPGALSDFQTAVRLAPRLSEGWYHLAAIFDRMGKKDQAEEARRHFQQMKVSEDEREKDLMRGVFLQSLGAQDKPR
jgi:tetratricopeptide (TPR) repeat protein